MAEMLAAMEIQKAEVAAEVEKARQEGKNFYCLICRNLDNSLASKLGLIESVVTFKKNI